MGKLALWSCGPVSGGNRSSFYRHSYGYRGRDDNIKEFLKLCRDSYANYIHLLEHRGYPFSHSRSDIYYELLEAKKYSNEIVDGTAKTLLKFDSTMLAERDGMNIDLRDGILQYFIGNGIAWDALPESLRGKGYLGHKEAIIGISSRRLAIAYPEYQDGFVGHCSAVDGEDVIVLGVSGNFAFSELISNERFLTGNYVDCEITYPRSTMYSCNGKNEAIGCNRSGINSKIFDISYESMEERKLKSIKFNGVERVSSMCVQFNRVDVTNGNHTLEIDLRKQCKIRLRNDAASSNTAVNTISRYNEAANVRNITYPNYNQNSFDCNASSTISPLTLLSPFLVSLFLFVVIYRYCFSGRACGNTEGFSGATSVARLQSGNNAGGETMDTVVIDNGGIPETLLSSNTNNGIGVDNADTILRDTQVQLNSSRYGAVSYSHV